MKMQRACGAAPRVLVAGLAVLAVVATVSIAHPFSNLFGVESAEDVRPKFVSLALAGPRGISVSWQTDKPTPQSVVLLGTRADQLKTAVQGTQSSYDGHNWQHNVVLRGASLGFDLEPKQQYFYRVGEPTLDGGLSQVFHFVAPMAPDDRAPFKVAMIGDMGISNSGDTLARLQELKGQVDFYYHVGDLSYADDRKKAEYEQVWDHWQSQMENITAYSPYMVLPGNHESSCNSLGMLVCSDSPSHNNFTVYNARFRMPGRESLTGADHNMWYSFDYGNVHFVSISTETDYPFAPEGRGTFWNAGPFGDQLGWLEADLARADMFENRKDRPFIIVSGHRPMYSNGLSEFPPLARITLRNSFEALFKKYNVDIYMSAHVHSYERFYPVYKRKISQDNYVNPRDPVHLVNGAGGNTEGHTKYWVPKLFQSVNSAFSDKQHYGYGVLEVRSKSELHWSYHNSADGSVLDDITIVKDSPY